MDFTFIVNCWVFAAGAAAVEAEIVTVALPRGVALIVLIVRFTFTGKDAVTAGLGLSKVQLAPAGSPAVQDRLTVPLNAPTPATWICTGCDAKPGTTSILDGFGVPIEKSTT